MSTTPTISMKLAEGSPQIAASVKSIVQGQTSHLSLLTRTLACDKAITCHPEILVSIIGLIRSQESFKKAGGKAKGVNYARSIVSQATIEALQECCRPAPDFLYEGVPCTVASLCDYCSFLVNFADNHQAAYRDMFRVMGGTFRHTALTKGCCLDDGKGRVQSALKYPLEEWLQSPPKCTLKRSKRNTSARNPTADTQTMAIQFMTSDLQVKQVELKSNIGLKSLATVPATPVVDVGTDTPISHTALSLPQYDPKFPEYSAGCDASASLRQEENATPKPEASASKRRRDTDIAALKKLCQTLVVSDSE